MKTTSIPAEPRAISNKAAIKQLRKVGRVPAVLYSDGKSRSISVDYADAKRVLFTSEAFIVQMEIDGKKTSAIVRDAQYHPVTDKIQHIDFLDVSSDKAIEISLPIDLIGTPKGVMGGGRLLKKLRKLTVKGKPSEMPERIEVNVTDLKLGYSIKVEDLDLDLHVTTVGSSAIASVDVPRALRGTGAGEEEEGDLAEGEEASEEATEE
jgi:large subunit ribosomal protein L25